MTWTQLLTSNEVKRHKTSKKELDSLRAVIIRDLADASLNGVSADRRFATAYNAALQAAKMAIACAGYRVAGAGHHRISFEAAKLAIGKAADPYSDYFDIPSKDVASFRSKHAGLCKIALTIPRALALTVR